MNTEFIPANLNAIELYSDFRTQLAALKTESNALVFDYATPKGNKEARSHIFSLRKVKGSLESARKEAKALDYGRLVDSKAKEIEAEIEGLIEAHDKPLREIEQREAERIAAIKARIDTLSLYQTAASDTKAETWAAYLAEVEAFPLDDTLQEFKAAAALAKDSAITEIKPRLAVRQKYEAEQVELARLRAESEARERKEREDRIAQEAATRATREAELAAERQREADRRAEQEREQRAAEAARQQELALERAKRETAEAEERAARAEQAAKERAERELKASQEAERLAAEKREANKKHQAKVNNAAVQALIAVGLGEEPAKIAVTAIAKHAIPNVTISY